MKSPFEHTPELTALQQRDMGLLKQTTPIASYPGSQDKSLPAFTPARFPESDKG